MNAILIAGGSFAALVILGAWLRWAVSPVLVGYRAGVEIGRMLQAKKDHDPSPGKPGRPLEAVLAWLMPMRAARIIGAERRKVNVLIRTLGYAVGDGRAELLDRDRPDSSEWYDRPMPLAALAAILRPGRAVRKLRSADQSIVWVIDAMMAQHRQHQEAGELADSSK